MNEPRRWRDSEDASDEVVRVLRASGPTRAMPAAAGERAKRRLASLALPAAASILFGWKGLAVAAIGVAGAAGGYAFVQHTKAHTPVSTPSGLHGPAPVVTPSARIEAAPAPPEPGPTASSDPVPVPSPEATGVRRPAPSAARTQSADDSLAAELALVGRGRSALASDPAAALQDLDEHARRYPNGQLAIERELLALDALERLGRRAEARRRAERLLVRARGTIYEGRVRAHLDPTP